VSTDSHNSTKSLPPEELFGSTDLPVFGTAQGGKGALIVTDRAVDWVVRPAPLLRVKDGYGMIISGESMSPKVDHGSTVLVNPHLPWRKGDVCVFRRHDEDGSDYAVVKELVRFTDDTWHVKQYNPEKTFTLSRKEWQDCHVTVGSYYAR
jgi:phage repressor protein C with HTH and peptisase S24 domain